MLREDRYNIVAMSIMSFPAGNWMHIPVSMECRVEGSTRSVLRFSPKGRLPSGMSGGDMEFLLVHADRKHLPGRAWKASGFSGTKLVFECGISEDSYLRLYTDSPPE